MANYEAAAEGGVREVGADQAQPVAPVEETKPDTAEAATAEVSQPEANPVEAPTEAEPEGEKEEDAE